MRTSSQRPKGVGRSTSINICPSKIPGAGLAIFAAESGHGKQVHVALKLDFSRLVDKICQEKNENIEAELILVNQGLALAETGLGVR